MDFPVDHLSASSIAKFLRCPRQWQQQYVYGEKGPSNSSLIIGSAVHLALSRRLKGLPEGDYWNEVIAEEPEIDWKKDSIETSRNIAKQHVHNYYERVGKHLHVIDTEVEISLDIPDVPIPVVGFVDIVAMERIIDLKTTGYFNRKPSLNPEWRLQGNIYQIYQSVPVEFHILTRSKTDPVVVPASTSSQLYIPPPNAGRTEAYVKGIWDVMEFYWINFGENLYPGNVTHPWAEKYCTSTNCCQR